MRQGDGSHGERRRQSSISRRVQCLRTPLLLSGVLAFSAIGPPGGAPCHAKRPSAAAAPGSAVHSPEDRAAALIAAAREALKQGKLSAVAPKLEQAYALSPTPAVLFELGRLALKEQRILEAHDLFRRYLADPNVDAGDNTSEVREAQEALSQPEPPSGQLSILSDRGTLVRVDGRLVGALPLSRPLLLSHADHDIELLREKGRLTDKVRTAVGRTAELRGNFESGALVLTVLPAVILREETTGLARAETDQLAQALADATLLTRTAPVRQAAAIESAGEPEPGPCTAVAGCELEQARKLEADYIATMRLSKRPPASWELTLELTDVSVGELAARKTETCASCTTEQAAKLLASMIGPLLLESSRRPRGQFAIRTTPGGAHVRLDDHVLGETPLSMPAWTGDRALSLRLPGYVEQRQSLTITEGQTTQLDLTLQLPAPVLPAKASEPSKTRKVWQRQPRPLWRVVTFSLLAGASLPLIGLGLRGLVIDNTDAPAKDGVEQVYDSAGIGATLSSAGFVLLGIGIAGAAWPGKRQLVEVPLAMARGGSALTISF